MSWAYALSVLLPPLGVVIIGDDVGYVVSDLVLPMLVRYVAHLPEIPFVVTFGTSYLRAVLDHLGATSARGRSPIDQGELEAAIGTLVLPGRVHGVSRETC